MSRPSVPHSSNAIPFPSQTQTFYIGLCSSSARAPPPKAHFATTSHRLPFTLKCVPRGLDTRLVAWSRQLSRQEVSRQSPLAQNQCRCSMALPSCAGSLPGYLAAQGLALDHNVHLRPGGGRHALLSPLNPSTEAEAATGWLILEADALFGLRQSGRWCALLQLGTITAGG